MKDAYFFSHDSNARNDPKILACRSIYGWAGVGMYWAIIEFLREQPSYRLSNNAFLYGTLSEQLHISQKKTGEFIKNCVEKFRDEHGSLFVLDENYFYSKSLLSRMEAWELSKDAHSKAAMKRWRNQPPLLSNNADTEHMHSTSVADTEHMHSTSAVSYTHLRAHETRHDLVC